MGIFKQQTQQFASEFSGGRRARRPPQSRILCIKMIFTAGRETHTIQVDYNKSEGFCLASPRPVWNYRSSGRIIWDIDSAQHRLSGSAGVGTFYLPQSLLAKPPMAESLLKSQLQSSALWPTLSKLLLATFWSAICTAEGRTESMLPKMAFLAILDIRLRPRITTKPKAFFGNTLVATDMPIHQLHPLTDINYPLLVWYVYPISLFLSRLLFNSHHRTVRTTCSWLGQSIHPSLPLSPPGPATYK